MLERDLTSQSGLIAKSLPLDWLWKRIPDLPHKHRGTVGFDGFLCFKKYGWAVEVKLGWNKLNANEKKVRKEFDEVGASYLILRYFEEYSYKEYSYSWVCEGVDDKAVMGDLGYVCQILEQGI